MRVRTRNTQEGFSLVDALLSIAVFAVFTSGVAGALAYAHQSIAVYRERSHALWIAQEGIEAVRALRDGAWNEMTLVQSGVEYSSGTWQWVGEGSDDTIGAYTRRVTLTDMCRDEAQQLVECPGAYTDVESKGIHVDVEWAGQFGVARSVSLESVLTHWDTEWWTQTDWSGGDGQSVWLDETRFESSSGNVITDNEELTIGSQSCGEYVYSFDAASDYSTSDSSLTVSSGEAALVPSGLPVDSATVGLWHFNESSGNVEDVSGRNNTLTTFGTPTYSASGQFATAVNFDSSGDYGQILDTEQSGLDLTGSMTIEAWVKKDSFVSNGMIATKWNVVSDRSYRLFISTTGVVHFDLRNGTLTVLAATPVGTIVAGTWYHIAAVYDGAFADIYVNGQRLAHEPYTGGIQNGVTPFQIGGSSANAFFGTIDEVRVSSVARYSTNFVVPTAPFGYTYATSSPSLQPTASYTPTLMGDWYTFAEDKTVAGASQVYYQLSDDDGATWQFYTGSAWAPVTTNGQYNTASQIASALTQFDPTAGSILFRAFFVSNGSDAVSLDSVTIQCRILREDTLDMPSDFVVGANIDMIAGTASLAETGREIEGVGDAPLSTLEHDIDLGLYPSALQITDTIYAIAYSGTDNDGFVRTFTIDASGQINSTPIDSLEFNTRNVFELDFIHVTGSIYAVVYRGPSSDGFIKTLTIDSSGVIGDATIDVLEFDTFDGFEPDIIHISGTVYAIAYRGTLSDGFVITLTIDSAGSISNAIVDSLEFDTFDGFEPDIVHVSGAVYAIAYRGTALDGFVVTMTIDSAGSISNAVIDSFEFDPLDGMEPDIIHMSGTVYAIAYRGTGADGFVITLTISDAGDIGSSVIDSFEFDPINGLQPKLAIAEGNYVVVAYSGNGNDGYLALITISDAGDIGSSVIDFLEFDTGEGTFPSLQPISSTRYFIAYTGVGNDGFITTIDLTTVPTYSSSAPSLYGTASWEPTSPVHRWYTFEEVATKEGTAQIYYQLSDDDGATWQYYNGSVWATASMPTHYSTAQVVHDHLTTFDASDSQILWRAFLVSDGYEDITLDQVTLSYQEELNAASGGIVSLVSSAYNFDSVVDIETLRWTADTAGCGSCSIEVQIRAAPDNAGVPGTWTDWYGEDGVDTFFTTAQGSVLPVELNGYQWVQYRVELEGSTDGVPILEDITITYGTQ